MEELKPSENSFRDLRTSTSAVTKVRPASISSRHSKASHHLSHTGTKPHSHSSSSSIPPPFSLQNIGNGMDSLQIHSSPVPLATRSLSARSTPSILSASNSSLTSQQQNRSRSMSSRSSKRKTKTSSARNQKQTGGPQFSSSRPNKPGADVVQSGNTASSIANGHNPVGDRSKAHLPPGQGNGSAGFNIAYHLRNSTNTLRSSGSISPEINKLLSSVVGSVSPPAGDQLEMHTRSSNHRGNTQAVGTRGSSSNLQVKRSHRRPKLAANFEGIRSNQKEKVPTIQIPLSKIISSSSQHSNEHHGDTSTRLVSKDNQHTVAATKIQRWFRSKVDIGRGEHGHDEGGGESERRRQTKTVQSLLQEKKDELNRSKIEELRRLQSEVEARDREKSDREQRRAAKLKADRRAAIDELHKKREEKRQRDERIAQEEIALLQSSGKVKRPRSSSTHTKKASSKKKAQHQDGSDTQEPKQTSSAPVGGHEHLAGDKANSSRHSASAVPDQVIDNFFEAGSNRKVKPAVESGQSHNTYNDILETLKLLEEVPVPLRPQTHLQEYEGLSSDNLHKLTSTATPRAGVGVASSGGLSNGKLQSILSYLDEVEKAEVERSSQLTKSRTEARSRAEPSPRATPTTAMAGRKQRENTEVHQSELEAATAVASDVTATILAQRLELDNKSKTVNVLQKALNQQRELTVYHAKEMEKEGQKRIEVQKQEYEATIQRHQCFIDQLIDDKKVLSERCEHLVRELKEVDKKYRTKLKTTEDNHTAELNKIKQVTAAADKLRREKWRAEETQRIKEGTVKSLEPEIQRIIARGKAELQKQKALHEAELMQVDERASRRFVSQMEEVREQCAGEKEQACAHERELARQRYEKLAEQEELNYQQQRRRMFAEVAQDKERLASQYQLQKTNLDSQFREMREEQERVTQELKSEHSKQLEELHRRHSSELRDVQERAGIEKQAWEENFMKRQETNIAGKEREMRAQLRQERDKEIEMVISRLEEETASSKEECERAAEARIRRIREKYEAELREVERSERGTLEKFNTIKTQVVDLEGETTRLRSLLRQREQEVERVGEVATKLTRERDNVADVVRQEFADRLVSTEEENKQLKIERSELRARHKVEVERVGRTKDRELQEVHEKVKTALEKKEENLSTLREQYEAALKRADHLQMLLQRQRKELLKK